MHIPTLEVLFEVHYSRQQVLCSDKIGLGVGNQWYRGVGKANHKDPVCLAVLVRPYNLFDSRLGKWIVDKNKFLITYPNCHFTPHPPQP